MSVNGNPHTYRAGETWLNIYSLMYYAAGAFKKRWLENSHLKCSCNIKARVGGKLNGTEINNGRLDVFANWDLWHSGSKGLRQAKPFEEFCCVGVVRYNNMLCSQTNTYTLRTWEFFYFFLTLNIQANTFSTGFRLRTVETWRCRGYEREARQCLILRGLRWVS